MTCMWKWKTVCHAAAPKALSRLTPSAPSASFWRSAIRLAISATAARSSGSISPRSVECAFGITSAWPCVPGLMSMKAIVRSSSSIFVAGSSPATILQKMQSGSEAMRRRLPASVRRPMADPQAAIRHLETIERGTASPGEREAAEWIAGDLRALGADAHTEAEQVHGGYWVRVGAAAGIAAGLAALALRGRARLGALVGGALATASVLDDISGGPQVAR